MFDLLNLYNLYNMNFKIGNSDELHTSNSVTIVLNDDVEFRITKNKFGELVIQKEQYGDGESCILIRPSVSNEIKIG